MSRTVEASPPSGSPSRTGAGFPATNPEPVPDELDPDRVPAHVAWALAGHDRAEAAIAGPALLDLVDGALALGVRWLTVQALSAADLDHPGDRLAGLLAGLEALVGDAADQLAGRGVRLRLTGRRPLPEPLAGLLHRAVDRTAAGDRLTLTLALGYGGRAEIVDAIAALADRGVAADQVDEAAISRHLYHPDMPDPDLVVRPSGDPRVSDLLLWEVAYSELVFLDTPWTDVRRGHLYQAVLDYQRRDRRYGGLDAATPDRRGPR
ncbi:MAG TPA: undecaprenyl diphosphate synthase family protein [Acidimicrobiales bacterium]|nr:undecaprenyl diphosphate synthase family protein [Acidimicrobiales bacterium]